LQFSSEEEMGTGSDGGEVHNPDDDSQQVAEAMVQLGNMGYYAGGPDPLGSMDQGNRHRKLTWKLF